MAFNLIKAPSPNFDERNADIDMIILHYTGMKTGVEAISRLRDPASKVSSHYVVEENGDVYQLVDDSKRAWHAGVSFWRGKNNLNANSIGIEIVNPGHEFGYREFTPEQYKSIIELCKSLKAKYKIADINIIGHSDIAPNRKQDPGELFNWKLLADNGIGIWHLKSNEIKKCDLTQLGYEHHDEKSIIAFQRHWRQDLISGIWDSDCAKILISLIERQNN